MGVAGGRFGQQGGVVEIEPADLGEPAFQLFEILVVFLELGIGEVLGRGFLGDLRFEIRAFVDELTIGLVAIGREAADDLVLLGPVEADGFRQHRLSASRLDLVLDDLQAAQMIVGPRQQADAALEIDRARGLELPPKRDALDGRFRWNPRPLAIPRRPTFAVRSEATTCGAKGAFYDPDARYPANIFPKCSHLTRVRCQFCASRCHG